MLGVERRHLNYNRKTRGIDAAASRMQRDLNRASELSSVDTEHIDPSS